MSGTFANMKERSFHAVSILFMMLYFCQLKSLP